MQDAGGGNAVAAPPNPASPAWASRSAVCQDAIRVFQKWLYLPSLDPLLFCWAVTHANRLGQDMLWGGIIGPPGDTKTAILQTLDGAAPNIIALDDLTPNTLISGLKREDAVDGEEPSLLRRLDGGMFIVKDFTTLLAKRRSDRDLILGQLRAIYDKSFAAAFGTGELKRFDVRFGVLLASTPQIEEVWSTGAALGERFLYWKALTFNREDAERKTKASQDNADKAEELNAELRAASHSVLKMPAQCALSKPDPETAEQLRHIAGFVAAARTPVPRDYRTRAFSGAGGIEGRERPTRLIKQLMLLAWGIESIGWHPAWHPETLRVLARVGLSSIPRNRMHVLRYLAACGQGTTTDIADGTRLNTATVLAVCDELRHLGLLDRTGDDRRGYVWTLSEESTGWFQGTWWFNIWDA